MKKLLLSALALIGAVSMKAQLSDGMKAQDFTFTALNNNSQVVNLYSMLDSGKYVFLDVSATWCGPCWSYHNTHALEDLYTQHGPGTTSNDIRVIWVDGDGATTDADMNGTGTNTQGNWLTGVNFPMCNPASALVNPFNDNYEIGYFPTIYMICPDRTVKEVGQLTAAQLYAEVSPTAQCPAKINVDVAPITFTGKLISCDGNYSFVTTIKNRGFNNLTNATINVKNGATTLLSTPWTGNLTTYQTSGNINLNLTGVPSNVDSLTIEVLTTGDQIADNNNIVVYIDNYSQPNAQSIPFTQNFDSDTKLPSRFGYADVAAMSKFGFYDGINGTTKLTGSNGNNTKALFVNFYNTAAGNNGILTVGNFNTNTTSTNLNFDFDVAYAQYSNENDQLELLVSTDCGATWTSKWSKSGSALSTSAAQTSSFIPNAANKWRKESVNLNSVKNQGNVLVAYKMTSAYGNYAWVDNINLYGSSTPASIADLESQNIDIYPNPAISELNIRGIDGDALINIIDVLGRNIKTINVQNNKQEIKIDVNGITLGNYILKVTQQGKSYTKSFTIGE